MSDEEYIDNIIDDDPELSEACISNEDLRDSIKKNFLETGRRFSERMTGLTTKGKNRGKEVERIARELIGWLQDKDKEHPRLDLQVDHFFFFMKTRKFIWWKFYYILNDDAYNELLRAIDSGKTIKLSDWMNKYTKGAIKAFTGLTVSMVGLVHDILNSVAGAATSNLRGNISSTSGDKLVRDKRTGEEVGRRNQATHKKTYDDNIEKFSDLVDMIDNHRKEVNTFIKKNKKGLEETFGDIVNAREIKDLIVIVETYRSRVSNIYEKLEGAKSKIDKFPTYMLVAGIVDLEATLKNVVELAKNLKERD